MMRKVKFEKGKVVSINFRWHMRKKKRIWLFFMFAAIHKAFV